MSDRDIELKKAIVNWVFENKNEFQLMNKATEHFRQYIYDSYGYYCIGGEDVHSWIEKAIDYVTGI